jgi:hypothetical protein
LAEQNSLEMAEGFVDVTQHPFGSNGFRVGSIGLLTDSESQNRS